MPEDKPQDDKTKRTIRAKVVEVEESAKTTQTPEEAKPEANPMVTSFSQLDSKPNEKAEIATDIANEKVSEVKTATENTNTSPKTEDAPSDPQKPVVSNDWLKDIRPDTSKEVEKGSSRVNVKAVIVILLLFAGVAAITGGAFYYKTKVASTGNKNETVTETPVATTAATTTALSPTSNPTPTVSNVGKVDYTKLTLNILNGTGIPGEAGKIADLIKSLKFKSVKSGNADSFDYTVTTIKVKKDLSSKIFDDINALISNQYSAKISDTPLDATSAYDVVIIVGPKK